MAATSIQLLQRLHRHHQHLLLHLRLPGLRWTAAFPKSEAAAVTIYLSRKADVARLDEFIGPKR